MVDSERSHARALLAALLLIAPASCASSSSGPVLTLNVTHPGAPPAPCNDNGNHAFTLRPVDAQGMDTREMPRVTTGGDHVKLIAVAGDDRITPGGTYYATRDGKRIITLGPGLFVWDVADLTLRRVIDHKLDREEMPLMLTPDGRTGIFKTKTGFRRVDLMSGEITDVDKGAAWSLPLINHKLREYPQPPITKSPRPRALDGHESYRWYKYSTAPPPPRAWLFPDGERWLSLRGFNYVSAVEGRGHYATWYADRWELSVNPVSTDASTGPIKLVINGRSALADVAPSANGRALAALTAGLRVWSTDTGELLGEVADVRGADKVALSPDGSAAVTWFSREFKDGLFAKLPSVLKHKASAGFVTVWDVRSGKERWRQNRGFVDAIEFTGTGRYLFQTIWTKTREEASILDASTGLEKFRPNVSVDGVLPSSDILVVGDERRSSLLSIDTESYLTSVPDGYVLALFPGATHFVGSMNQAGDMRMLGDGRCVKLRVPESAQLSVGKQWRGNKTLSAEVRIGEYRREWVLDQRPKALAVWRADDGVLTTLLKLTGNDELSYNYLNHIPSELEYRSSRNPGGYFQVDPITGGVGPFRLGEARNYAEEEHTTKVRVKLGDAGAHVTMYALTSSVTRTRRGILALIREDGPFWVLNQSDGHAVKLPGDWPNFAWFQRVQFSPSGNLVAVMPGFDGLLIYDTRTGALLAEMDFGPRFDYADIIAFADPARELLVYTKRGRLFRFSLDESFPP